MIFKSINSAFLIVALRLYVRIALLEFELATLMSVSGTKRTKAYKKFI